MAEPKCYHIVNDELLIRLLIGRQVRYFSPSTGVEVALLIAIIDIKEKVFQFRKYGELHHNPPYIVENAEILLGDWNWDDVYLLSDARKLMKIRKEAKEFYDDIV